MSDDAISRQIGKFVRHHRIEQNKTQDTLAKDARISHSTLSLLERGGETVTLATLIQVLRVLDLFHVIDAFTIVKQHTLQLARAEKKKRQRVSSSKNTTKDTNDETGW